MVPHYIGDNIQTRTKCWLLSDLSWAHFHPPRPHWPPKPWFCPYIVFQFLEYTKIIPAQSLCASRCFCVECAFPRGCFLLTSGSFSSLSSRFKYCLIKRASSVTLSEISCFLSPMPISLPNCCFIFCIELASLHELFCLYMFISPFLISFHL